MFEFTTSGSQAKFSTGGAFASCRWFEGNHAVFPMQIKRNEGFFITKNHPAVRGVGKRRRNRDTHHRDWWPLQKGSYLWRNGALIPSSRKPALLCAQVRLQPWPSAKPPRWRSSTSALAGKQTVSSSQPRPPLSSSRYSRKCAYRRSANANGVSQGAGHTDPPAQRSAASPGPASSGGRLGEDADALEQRDRARDGRRGREAHGADHREAAVLELAVLPDEELGRRHGARHAERVARVGPK